MAGEIATIKFDNSYFAKSRNEYSNDIRFIWIREAIQNSVDAGAKNINIEINSESRTITLIDDGRGMNEDILLNKLLTLGGSHKDSPDAVGGFGKAKEVLFFTWESWSITTCMDGKTQYYLTSEMLGNQPIGYDNGNHPKGTKIEIKYDEGMSAPSWISEIRFFVSLCTTKATITLNDVILEQMDKRGAKRELDWANVQIKKKQNNGMMIIRVHGVAMFYEGLDDSSITTILDLTKDSTTILTSSRESLKWSYDREYQKLYRQVIVNPVTVFDKQTSSFVNTYKGETIKQTLKNMFADIIPESEIEQIVDENSTNEGTTFDYCIASAIATKIREENQRIEQEAIENNEIEIITHPEVNIDELRDSFVQKDLIMHSPFGFEFVVKVENYKKVPKDVFAKKPQTILHYWRNILLQFMEIRGYTDDIGVGLLYTRNIDDETKKYVKSETQAQMEYINNKVYLLINPEMINKTGNAFELGHYLFNKLSHEYAHISHSNHDQQHSYLTGTYQDVISTHYKEMTDTFKKSKKETTEIFKDGRANNNRWE
jgi:hypothetical protein